MDISSISESGSENLFVFWIVILEIECICWPISGLVEWADSLDTKIISISEWTFLHFSKDSWFICCEVVDFFEYVLLSSNCFV